MKVIISLATSANKISWYGGIQVLMRIDGALWKSILIVQKSQTDLLGMRAGYFGNIVKMLKNSIDTINILLKAWVD